MSTQKQFDIVESLIGMISELNTKLKEEVVISWASPIMSFGAPHKSKIATLGINPSNREFVDGRGDELNGQFRRFQTLNSLKLNSWRDAVNEKCLSAILASCHDYFSHNPYDGWFKKLDNLIANTGVSYYFPSFNACHLDLIPYATYTKWGKLSMYQQNVLLNDTSDILGKILNCSSIEILILNGQTVTHNLERISGATFSKTEMPSWSLPRKASNDVGGYSYTGTIHRIGSTVLNRPVTILGYNHNIQSSYGVTSKCQTEIKNWIYKAKLYEAN